MTLTSESVEFFLENSERGCRSDYVFREASDRASNYLIFSYPTSDEMGLNAQIMIFAAPAYGGLAQYIGSIPAGVSDLEDGSYKDIQQSGNSIYERIYRIDRGEVVTMVPRKELIIAGKQCVYKVEGDSACEEMLGSFDSPICVLNEGERKILAAVNECADMSKDF
ncbi:hypothetical protein [Pseudomonas sp. TWP3-2]|uniref:hypothetical protein n=1 Tax=Pseudomonas sp. TWP3-2 TaxID=2804574 RepID=UPI003CEDE2B6